MAQSFLNRTDIDSIGLQNNNIGNLRGSDAWQGKVGMSANGGYVQFENIAWGIRAFITNLYTQINKYGLDTPKKYLEKYAPTFENKTQEYINKFSNDLGIGENDKIPTDTNSLRKIVRSQMEMELGKKYADLVTDNDINEGISLVNNSILSYFGASIIFAKSNPIKVAIIFVIIFAGISATLYLKGKSK